MIYNLLKIAFRNILKSKVIAIINIIGLTIGITTTFIIGAVALHELSFNSSILDKDRIFRVVTKVNTPDGTFYNRGVPVPFGQMIRNNVLGLEDSAMFFEVNQSKAENNKTGLIYLNPDKIIYVNNNYFKLFKYNWLAGNKENALNNPNEVVLTKKRANKYFPNISEQAAIGKTYVYNDSIPVTVVGVVSDIEEPTDFYFQEFISDKSAAYFGHDYLVHNLDWLNSSTNTQLFIKINTGESLNNISSRIRSIFSERVNEVSSNSSIELDLMFQPLDNLHFNSDYGIFENSDYVGNKKMLTVLSLAAAFLLLLSCINFINLNTAQGLKRYREIGIRKTLGSSRNQLILQFIGEALILTSFAAILSIIISLISLNWLDYLFPGNINISLFNNQWFILFTFSIIVIVTIISGVYPSLVLSNYRPTIILRKKGELKEGKISLRKSLTIFQFTIAQLFLITTLFVTKQTNFLINSNIGFRTDSLVSISLGQIPEVKSRLSFKRQLNELANINNTSLNTGTPFQALMALPLVYKGIEGETLTYVTLINGDTNYLNLFEIELVAGRERINDTIDEYVINETYSKKLGFQTPDEAIGKFVYKKNNNIPIPIVGVMRDFNNAPLNYETMPIVLMGAKNQNFNNLSLVLNGTPENWGPILHSVKEKWNEMFPTVDFELRFVDETLQSFYQLERKISFLMKLCSVLAILISCLGLIGLVIYILEKRTKEIGIRKLLGASFNQINYLIAKDLLTLLVIGFVISLPISFWIIQRWLSGFAYRIPISWWVFLIGLAIMVSITFFTVGYRIASKIRKYPVKNLSNE